jgi:hypothetical protein
VARLFEFPRDTLCKSVVVATLITLISLAARPTHAEEGDSIFCRAEHKSGSVTYTGIFTGDGGKKHEYAELVRKYMDDDPDDIQLKSVTCYSETYVEDARDRLKRMGNADRDNGVRHTVELRSLKFLDPIKTTPSDASIQGCVTVDRGTHDEEIYHYFILHTCHSVGRLNVKACFPKPANSVSWLCNDGLHSTSLEKYMDEETVPTIRSADGNPLASFPGPAYIAVCEAPKVPVNVRIPELGNRGPFNYECGPEEAAPPSCSANSIDFDGTVWRRHDSSGTSFELRFDGDNGFTEQSSQDDFKIHGTWRMECNHLTMHWPRQVNHAHGGTFVVVEADEAWRIRDGELTPGEGVIYRQVK